MNFQDSSNLLYELAHFNSMYPNLLSNYQQMMSPQVIYNQSVKQHEKETQLENKLKEAERRNNELVSTIKELEEELRRYRKRRYSKKRLFLQAKHQCPNKECQKSYRSKTALKNHIKRKHGKNYKKFDKNDISSDDS